MLCVVKQFEKREDENRELPYYVIRATGTVGDVNATSAFNDDGTIMSWLCKVGFTISLKPCSQPHGNYVIALRAVCLLMMIIM